MTAQQGHIDLRALAHQAMITEGFEPDFTPEAARQAHQGQPARDPAGAIRDLRSLPWSSIDNTDSRDLDQVEFVERLKNGALRVLVGIADVDYLAPQNSPIDQHASHNTTSVYTGAQTFPMLPLELSTDRTSLSQGEDRQAVIIEMAVNPAGEVISRSVYRALIRNAARLSYESIGPWLEGAGPLPPEAHSPGMANQLRLQAEAAEHLEAERRRCGALDFETIEAAPVVKDGKVVDLVVPHKNRARYLIENFMVAANSAMAEFLQSRGIPTIQRIVRDPERWPRIVALAGQLGEALPAAPDAKALADFLARRRASDPVHFPDLSLSVVKLLGPGEYVLVRPGEKSVGHFGLAVHNYTHSTAPNRRFADLVAQRLLKAALAGSPQPYTFEELAAIAARCTDRENAGRKVERQVRKAAAAILFSRHMGEVFDAIVTGHQHKGTYVRVIKPPVEGRVIRGEEAMDVGDKVRVRLVRTDPLKGFIDFEAA